MTERELSQYKAIKSEIADLKRRIEETKRLDKTFQIAGTDPAEAAQRQEKVLDLLRQRETQKDELVEMQREMEDYINKIPDSLTRVIFRMYFFDGLNQLEIGRKTGYDQGTVSRKIKSYFKLHSMHTITC